MFVYKMAPLGCHAYEQLVVILIAERLAIAPQVVPFLYSLICASIYFNGTAGG